MFLTVARAKGSRVISYRFSGNMRSGEPAAAGSSVGELGLGAREGEDNLDYF